MTILEAGLTVLRDAGREMSVKDIYDEILRRDLYKLSGAPPERASGNQLRVLGSEDMRTTHHGRRLGVRVRPAGLAARRPLAYGSCPGCTRRPLGA